MAELRDYFYLCLNCGGVSAHADWLALRYDDEGVLEPAPAGHEDPLMRCPNCRWLHSDDDGNPGIFDGTLAEVQAEWMRVVDDHWDDWSELAAAAVGHRGSAVSVGSRPSLVLGMLGEPMTADRMLVLLGQSMAVLDCISDPGAAGFERTFADARRALKEYSAHGLPLLVSDLARLERAHFVVREGDLWRRS
ncbi:MAG: hypothetical protein ACJ79H_17510 [Myxococcales bacterium]